MISNASISATLYRYRKYLAFFEEEYSKLPEGALIFRSPGGNNKIENSNYSNKKKYYVSYKVNGKRKQRPLGAINDPDGSLSSALKYKRGVIISIKILKDNIKLLEHLSLGKAMRSHIKFKEFDIFNVDSLLPEWFFYDDWSFATHCYSRGFSENIAISRTSNHRLVYDDKLKELWCNTSLYPKQKQEFIEYHKRHLVVNTGLGFKVRSKSEAMITLQVNASPLIFKYEEPLRLCILSDFESPTAYLDFNSYTSQPDVDSFSYRDFRFYFPDFTILLPDGRVVFWEHLGLMDDENYRRDNIEKLNVYARNGIYPGINLYLTYETKATPLDPETIDSIISNIVNSASRE